MKLNKFFQKIAALIALAIIVVVLVQSTWETYKYNFYIKKLPPALKVTKIVYSKHVSVGFAPSGNEGGIVVYKLPEEIAKRIQMQGIQFFSQNETANNIEYFEKLQWQETPIHLDEKWTGPTMGGEPISNITSPQIEVFMNRWTHLVSIDDAVKGSIDTSISAKGSFYTYLPSENVIIVIPDSRQVVFAYSG